ncbi:MAG TPA: D-lyxose/D-mannose family sugar isomerase [Candidatus Sulfopaludibacter sp.]|nr:D-lyxose/D-mannose family sugar isomerase [Candidatus Sulfopaludibacter sp.]
MKRSEINRALKQALRSFKAARWALPPRPRWDVTDCGLGRFDQVGLVLLNLAEQPEYCEKLMYSRHHQVTPMHTHRKKKEDIICRRGELAVELWQGHPEQTRKGETFTLLRNGEKTEVRSGTPIVLQAGERVTIVPGIYHAFWPESEEAIIGEVSTANDDAHDNFFVDPNIGRFPAIDEDEPPVARLLWEK